MKYTTNYFVANTINFVNKLNRIAIMHNCRKHMNRKIKKKGKSNISDLEAMGCRSHNCWSIQYLTEAGQYTWRRIAISVCRFKCNTTNKPGWFRTCQAFDV